MSFIAAILTAGLNPQNSALSRKTSYQPRPKAVPEEIKFDVRVLASPVPVFAVDDFGLCRMHLQTALRQARLTLHLEGFCFLLATTVHQSIVSIPTPWVIRMRPRHPDIERVVKKEIGQDWADHAALRRAAVSLRSGSILLHHGRFEPSFDVQQGPFARYMFPDGP